VGDTVIWFSSQNIFGLTSLQWWVSYY
jgi:hypothetical protein